jgi:hypothetical protein
MESDSTSTVLGASSAEELAEQAAPRGAKRGTKGKGAARKPEQLTEKEIERRHMFAVRLGSRLATTPFTVAAIVTANPDWRSQLADEELEELSEDWASCLEAWGVTASGKIIATIALALSYAKIGAIVSQRVNANEVLPMSPEAVN